MTSTICLNDVELTFQQDGAGAVRETIDDYLAEWVYPDAFKLATDSNDIASFERAIAYLVAKNGRLGGTVRLRNGTTYDCPGTIALPSGIVIRGVDGFPLGDETLSQIPHIVNSTESWLFSYSPPAPGTIDRDPGPSIIGVAIRANNAINFGFDDNALSYFYSNSMVRRCVIFPYSAKGGTGVRLIENYRAA